MLLLLFNFYKCLVSNAVKVDQTRDFQIFNLTLSQLSYPRNWWSTLYMYEVIVKDSMRKRKVELSYT